MRNRSESFDMKVQKRKQVKDKRANDRLARLEKMYQELTEIEHA